MVDIHVLVMGDTNPDWFAECIESLISENVTIHLTDGYAGDLGNGRADGYDQGDGEYVSYVDPDDLILPGAVDDCVELLNANPTAAAAYTLSDTINSAGDTVKGIPSLAMYRAVNKTSRYPAWTRAHPLIVYRRSVMEKILPEIREQEHLWADRWTIAFARRHGEFLCTETVGYCWRRHADQTHRTTLRETRKGAINSLGLVALVEQGKINGLA